MARTTSADLASFRDKIGVLDDQIGRGISQRLDLARRVARRKSEAALPLRDYAVEGEVVRRWVRRLRSAGVGDSRSEALARWLIEESIRVQEPILRRPRTRSPAKALDIGIVGGAGAMGRWLAEFFDAGGNRVSVIDPRASPRVRPVLPDLPSALERVDVLVFATPISTTAPLLRTAIADGGETLIFDVLSVKAPIARLLARGARDGRRVTSVHPMFGPSARTLSGRNLLIVGCGNREADAAARSLFVHSALVISEVRLQDHDRLMAESLGLSHAVNLLFLGALSASGVSRSHLSRVASTTFHRQSSLALSVAQEGVDLYLDIQASNPHSREVYRTMRTRLRELERIIDRHDTKAFRAWIANGQARLDPGPVAMRA
jgi:chorismate mutase / prephenate dehydrogenase